jgi:hypothetical protein
MCGKKKQSALRWYQYDNGEQFQAKVCSNCAEFHDKAVA